MSALETSAKPYLLTMIQGRRRTYYSGGQTLIATWATKTALTAGCRFDPIPASFYDYLYEHGQPSPGTRVWLAGTDRPYMTYIDYRPAKVSEKGVPPDTVNGYAALLGVAHLAFYVFARESSEPPDHEFGGQFREAFRQVWPIEGPLTYPPQLLLSLEDLDAVADTT